MIMMMMTVMDTSAVDLCHIQRDFLEVILYLYKKSSQVCFHFKENLTWKSKTSQAKHL